MDSGNYREMTLVAFLFNKIQHIDLPPNIQIGRRFIEQNALGFLSKRSGNQHALDLTAGKFGNSPLSELLYPCPFHGLPGDGKVPTFILEHPKWGFRPMSTISKAV